MTTATPTAVAPTGGTDSGLTITDLLDADRDSAREITDRVAEAAAVAGLAEQIGNNADSVRAQLATLAVPGRLSGHMAGLVEQAEQLRGAAQALATALTIAAESIATSADNAEVRHKPLADAVLDAGHSAPAAAEYHKE